MTDDGRGIPVDIHPGGGPFGRRGHHDRAACRRKVRRHSYKVSGGLHGVGVSVVNALSEYLLLTIHRDGKLHEQEYRLGEPQAPAGADRHDRRSAARPSASSPAPRIFTNIEFHYDILAKRLRELSFLNSGVRIELIDERDDKHEVFEYEGGISRVRPVPEPQPHGRSTTPSSGSTASRTRSPSRWRCSGMTPTRRACTATPTTSRRRTAARTWPASAAR